MNQKRVILNLGSNLGNKASNLSIALKYISKISIIENVSRVYASKSMLLDNQDRYFNVSATVSTTLSPLDMLKALQSIEKKMGKEKLGFWRERLIDIDIVDFNNEILKGENLEIPHYDLENRSFFLIPLKEIFPGYIHPVTKSKIVDIIKNIKCDYDITAVGELKWR
ncbi:2-amino-4-hydroxy-6-hydroxymethyldihydropteridine diphosphokinase [Deferribacterales bacterium Es71-Z0220]|uniref:2-amino-4-hydroxy-6- hydroxymethyldihydropteridine diphosphokinase n=1 Tax=Deferrivibrio essentukiensis TaxID=2880922 RepID=UPI001F61FE4B|nr:2-amino-4-hydroxy-6-hydroxymethyldihydropteridine diphosphokinase [Deferrivibrio essentukiensis]MCB4203574.1 2-amino-4-hydroxy-6-hydroxymethyldihydropteridine diphosphokinase [Deferrivibrio essentukiensis]